MSFSAFLEDANFQAYVCREAASVKITPISIPTDITVTVETLYEDAEHVETIQTYIKFCAQVTTTWSWAAQPISETPALLS